MEVKAGRAYSAIRYVFDSIDIAELSSRQNAGVAVSQPASVDADSVQFLHLGRS